MLKNLLKDKRGFTLIEVVLVLAIAALIMVIVFIGVSGANAARRDIQRKSDINRLRAAMEQFSSNNQSTYPAVGTGSAALAPYLNTFTDPADGPYVINFSSSPTAAVARPTINVGYSAKCVIGSPVPVAASSAKQYALTYTYEQGGAACVDNQ